MTPNNTIVFPIRINTYLARKGLCTRTQADKYIEQKKVFVNNKVAMLGYQVQEKDVVELRGVQTKAYTYALWYKPRGVTTPESKIITLSGKNIKTFCIGRLDKDTDGLILLSDDTRLTERLLNPKYAHEKEYEVAVREDIVPPHLKRLEGGVRIMHEGKKITVVAKEAFKVEKNILGLVLTEGKKHQVRQMCNAVHLTITHLSRTRIEHLELKRMRRDSVRTLTEEEVVLLLQKTGLQE